MRQREKRQHPTGRREGILNGGRGRTKIPAQCAPPDFRIGVGVVTQPAPKAVGVEIFLKIILRREGRVGISAATPRLAAAYAANAFE